MYEYKFKLDFKVQNCYECPFRHEKTITENVNSPDTLAGTVSIVRKISHCVLRKELITFNQSMGYNSKCPLQNNIIEINGCEESQNKKVSK